MPHGYRVRVSRACVPALLVMFVAWAGTPVEAQETAADPVPVDYGMKLVEAIGLGPTFDDLNLKFYGWVEQSYTFNTDSPDDDRNVLRVFEDRSNGYRFNQLMVNLERPLADGTEFDIGGKIELLYGSDARFIHSRGLADNIGDDPAEFDPVQFYGLVRLPVGNGITMKFGKFVTMLGAEVIDAPTNALYSRSILFGYAIPFTHTGVQFDYRLNDQWGIYYSLVQGWDVWDDSNETLSHVFGFNYAKDNLTVYFNLITGPEQEDENTTYRTVADIVATYQWSDSFSTTVNVDYGHEDNLGGHRDYWAGVAAYATYTFNPQLAATVRAEYMRDATASRIGFVGDVYEVTAGLDIHPLRNFMNLRVRPEIRWDHAAGDTPYDQGTEDDQVTIGADVILTF